VNRSAAHTKELQIFSDHGFDSESPDMSNCY